MTTTTTATMTITLVLRRKKEGQHANSMKISLRMETQVALSSCPPVLVTRLFVESVSNGPPLWGRGRGRKGERARPRNGRPRAVHSPCEASDRTDRDESLQESASSGECDLKSNQIATARRETSVSAATLTGMEGKGLTVSFSRQVHPSPVCPLPFSVSSGWNEVTT